MLSSVIDTADWLLAVPIATLPGQDLDLSDTLLTVALTPTLGGAPIATASSEAGTLTFVPATDDVPPYFAIDLRVADRTWRIGRPTVVLGDIKRHPDPGNLARTEWVGRVELKVHPGSDSTGLAGGGYAPVLIPAQPYENRLVTAPLMIGPQGAPGALPALPPDASTKTYTLAAVNGALTWV
ncbi:hypothetical protein DK389_25125 [Methylobacterium durans]|uniref:Uncharacterized protein n=1 Tax=Methylobacterium durans TaxID=2202825 RepID=A0A2U8WC35_9HYPH|nr:hypothetical protein DK389_25125 [Methylobacterium durans]